MISFLLDEHLPLLYIKALKLLVPGIDIRNIGGKDAPAKATPDDQILIWCEAHNFVLITNDRDTIPSHAHNHFLAGRHVPGILMLRRSATLSSVIEDLELFAWDANDDEFRDRIVSLPL